jgi:sugar phosphate isomerase/epimerase
MQVGIKIFPDRIPIIPQYAKIADFIEVMASNQLNLDDLKNFSIPITIHVQHTDLGVNPADKNLEKINLKAVRLAQKAADAANSDIIILHPGDLTNKSCSLKNSLDFFKKINDPRIVTENLGMQIALCRTPEEIAVFKENGFDFCFDFGHAVITAWYLKKDYKDLVKQFVKLKPAYFHICDGIVNSNKDHLNFHKGNYDLNFFKKLIGNKRVALETEKSPVEEYKKQIDFLKNGD